MRHEHAERNTASNLQGALGLLSACARASASALARVSAGPHRPPVRLSAIGA